MDHGHKGSLHALETAHEKLKAALNQGISEFKNSLTFSHSQDVGRAIERFVDAVPPAVGAELRRRAGLVEKACGAGSEFAAARAAALQVYRAPPHLLTIGALPEEDGTHYLAVVADYREQIYRALHDEALHATPGALEAYERWGRACDEVQREADPLEVDGCRLLQHIAESRAAFAETILDTSNLGGASLEPMKDAADSLVKWAQTEAKTTAEGGEPAAAAGRPATPKRRGRKKADYETVQKEAALAASWERAREAGVYKGDFARERGTTVAKLDALLDRVAQRKKRSDN